MLRSGAPCQAVGEILRQSTRDDLSAGGVEAVARPRGGGACVWIEPVEVEEARDGVLVVASRDHLRALGQSLDARARVGAVAHDVAQAENRVRASGDVG